MAVLSRILGSRQDIPFIEGSNFAAASATTDYEHPVLIIPNITVGASSGSASMYPTNDIYIRYLALTPEAAITGAATNNCILGFRQYRAGSPLNLINTQNTASITAGARAVTPVTGTLMKNIQVGTILHVAAGGGTAEDVIVTAVSYAAGTFTATFAFSHNANTAITGTYLASVWYNAGTVTETAYTTHQLTPIANQFLPGDVLTFQHIHYGTGLSGGPPALSVFAEYVSLAGSLPKS
jgi:hypothetical protein